jgi:hypothetical protein
VAIGKGLFYPERSYPNLIERARDTALPSAELDALEAWLPDGRVSQKREDALAMLRVMNEWEAQAEPPLSVDYHFEHTDVWEQVVSRSGRQLAAARPDFQPHQLLLEELALDRDAYDRAVGGALARALALAEAERHDIDVGVTLVNEAVTVLRRQHALVDPDALSRWIALQELDLEQFSELVEQEAKIGWVRTMYAPDMVRCLPDWLRASGRYRVVADRARDKQRVLAAYGLETPSLVEAPVDEAALLKWFFEDQRGTHVPARLDLHAHAVGFANRAAFVRAALREYYYVTLSNSA